jgi:hypothetical protein
MLAYRMSMYDAIGSPWKLMRDNAVPGFHMTAYMPLGNAFSNDKWLWRISRSTTAVFTATFGLLLIHAPSSLNRSASTLWIERSVPQVVSKLLVRCSGLLHPYQ